jgi:HKD family nuclease
MEKQILKINNELKELLPKAEEIWVAVATMSDFGIKQIQENINPEAKQNILVGIDLPTPPSVLKELKQLQDEGKGKVNAKYFFKKDQFFHPKLYIIKVNNSLISIVGSGNCTEGGLEKHIEISIKTDEQEVCQYLIEKYFNIYFKLGLSITTEFISEYKALFERREKRDEQDKQDISVLDKSVSNDYSIKDLDFTNQFFEYAHFAAFEDKKPYSSDESVNKERYEVKKRLMKLHDLLYPHIESRKWDLHPHHKSDNIVSSHAHSLWTGEEIGGLWLHYGRSEQELKRYEKGFGKNQSSKYHMRLQVFIRDLSIDIQCRVGIKDGSVLDREHFKRQMQNDEKYRAIFFQLCQSLDDQYEIRINDTARKIKIFSSPDDLFEFTKNDKSKFYFIIGKSLKPNDKAISKSNIVKTIMEEFEKLEPIYEHIRHRF